MTEAFKASLSALYARRAVAAEFACRGMLNPHTDSSEQWLLHDELFYKYAFDVPSTSIYKFRGVYVQRWLSPNS